MIYREYLVMRKALPAFVGVLAFVLAAGIVTRLLQIGPGDVDASALTTDAGWLAAIFASIFGVALGNGSRTPAQTLWVLPVPRWKLALQIVAVDLAGTTFVYVCGYALMLVVSVLAGNHFRPGTPSPTSVLMALAMAYAAYGWSALAGMLGRRLAYSGLIALPALMIWMILAQADDVIGTALRAPSVLNPFAVFNSGLALESPAHQHFTHDPTASSLQWLGTTWATPVLLTIAVATCGLAIALWQRAEAVA